MTTEQKLASTVLATKEKMKPAMNTAVRLAPLPECSWCLCVFLFFIENLELGLGTIPPTLSPRSKIVLNLYCSIFEVFNVYRTFSGHTQLLSSISSSSKNRQWSTLCLEPDSVVVDLCAMTEEKTTSDKCSIAGKERWSSYAIDEDDEVFSVGSDAFLPDLEDELMVCLWSIWKLRVMKRLKRL